jgi:hypothetical protein
MRVAWYIALADQFSGSVRYNTSSQFDNPGNILNAFGTFPDLYLLNSLPTLIKKLTHSEKCE